MQKDYLTNVAAETLLQILRSSLVLGIVGVDTFLARIAALREMCRPDSGIHRYCATILLAEEWGDDERDWNDEISGNEGRASVRFGKISANSEESDEEVENEDNFILLFIPSASTNLSGWQFRPGDPDPNPSVPHGHGIMDARMKLDPYLGHTYRKSHPQGRVKRRDIIALWNDSSFRHFALISIRHFVQLNRDWNWHGRNPLILPRRRRK